MGLDQKQSLIAAGAGALLLGVGATLYALRRPCQGNDLPSSMRAVLLKAYLDDDAEIEERVQVQHVPLPIPTSGQVLIKVKQSPINPSDVAYLSHKYPSSSLPLRCGFEGAGLVVATGGGAMARTLMGKRVAFICASGAWAEYVAVDAFNCIVLPEPVTYQQGCAAIVNPLTVLAFLDISQKKGCRTVINTAGHSALGQMLIRMGKERGVHVIALVRNSGQQRHLVDIGALKAISTDKGDWRSELRQAASQHSCTLAFDCVGGETTGEVLHCMPPGSEVQVYGALAGTACEAVHPHDLIFGGGCVAGFWLKTFLTQRSPAAVCCLFRTVPRHLHGGLSTAFGDTYPLSKVAAALDAQRNGPSGKLSLSIN